MKISANIEDIRMKEVYHSTLGVGGRLVIPAMLRQSMHMKEGDTLLLEAEEGAIRIVSQEIALKELQSFFRRHIPAGTSAVDDLIKDRREEAKREKAESH